MKKILSLARQAIQKYNMIDSGDVIAVGVSGGKDSLVLLKTLAILKDFYPKSFCIKAVTVDAGFENSDYGKIKDLCNNLGIEYTIEKTKIKEIVFDNLQERSPCALCSKMRRAALCDLAESLNCNKIALGHNFDDAVETYMMNIIYNGKAMCFEPVTRYEDRSITLIRPLVFADEYTIKKCAKDNNLPITEKLCPADGNTKREETKKLLREMKRKNANVLKNIFTVIKNSDEFKKYEVSHTDENDE